ncbi:Sulfate transporter [Trypanosoma theileri]|uniref:Sulfate transporter n=1 Tax=Trypanosoma theileri TaxID=67003 RepID=A0A1X0NY03_9TRYP|nr:Sulfate transporter [Trypanosoma theileri]ORC89109.1 Sulfate transporter [Trypanosoma theileri]
MVKLSVKPVDVFGFPTTALGERLPPQRTWLEWVFMPRHKPLFHHFMANVRAGLTVSLVNVPLSIALAIGSGATPEQGIVSCVWAGAVAAVLGSSHFNVIGPTGALSGLLASMVASYGVPVLAPLALQAGLWIFLFLLFRINHLLRFVSSGVAHGFGCGVAIVIAVGQIPSALGLQGVQPKEKLLEKLMEDYRRIDTLSIPDTLLFLVTIIPLLVLSKRYNKIPWQIVFTLFGVLVAHLLPKGSLVLLSMKYPNLSLNFFSFVSLDELIDSKWFDPTIILYGFGIATVGLMETLISSLIANNHVEDKSYLNYSSTRDTFGLAMANVVSAFVGGIPSTAALARTALMVHSGAFSRLSGILSCVAVALLCSLLLPLFRELPMATVAAILMVVAYKLVDFHDLRVLHIIDTANLYSTIITCAACILTDTFIGLMVGIFFSVLLNYSDAADDAVLFEEEDETYASPRAPEPTIFRVLLVQPQESILFINAEKVKATIFEKSIAFRESMPPGTRKRLVLDMSHVTRVDFDGTKTLGAIISAHREKRWAVDVINCQHLRNSLVLCTPYQDLQKLEYRELY